MVRWALHLLFGLRRSRLLGHLFPLPVALLSRRLLPSIVSLRPSTVCALSWAGCRSRPLLRWIAVSRTLMFLYFRVAFPLG